MSPVRVKIGICGTKLNQKPTFHLPHAFMVHKSKRETSSSLKWKAMPSIRATTRSTCQMANDNWKNTIAEQRSKWLKDHTHHHVYNDFWNKHSKTENSINMRSNQGYKMNAGYTFVKKSRKVTIESAISGLTCCQYSSFGLSSILKVRRIHQKDLIYFSFSSFSKF